MNLKNNLPENFEEGIHPFWMRAEIPEVLFQIPYIRLKGEKAGKPGVYIIDGYYFVQKGKLPVRQMREYDVNSMEKADKMAKKDGLSQGIMIECILTESQPCVLGSESINFKN